MLTMRVDPLTSERVENLLSYVPYWSKADLVVNVVDVLSRVDNIQDFLDFVRFFSGYSDTLRIEIHRVTRVCITNSQVDRNT